MKLLSPQPHLHKAPPTPASPHLHELIQCLKQVAGAPVERVVLGGDLPVLDSRVVPVRRNLISVEIKV